MKTILLLDDEVSLMKLMSHVLVRRGFVVWESSNAEEAIARFLVSKARSTFSSPMSTCPRAPAYKSHYYFGRSFLPLESFSRRVMSEATGRAEMQPILKDWV